MSRQCERIYSQIISVWLRKYIQWLTSIINKGVIVRREEFRHDYFDLELGKAHAEAGVPS